MKIALGADHGGFLLKDKIKSFLLEKGYEVIDFGTNSADSVNYPVYGKSVANAVVNKEADFGIVICGTGIGISIAANKVRGIRCALCMNSTMATLTREHNDANVLALGERMIGDVLALDIVDKFLNTEFLGGRHATRVAMLEEN